MNTTQPNDRAHFILPDLGEGIHEAELIRWIVQPGDAVDELQPMAEMETDKALVEVPSPWAGVIKELHGKEGDIITVGSILVSYELGGSTPTPLPSSPGQETADMEPTAGEPAAETEAKEEDAGTVVGTMDEAMTVPASLSDRREPPPVSPPSSGRIISTPAVRGIARELGIDIATVFGTGRGGRITASDVQEHARLTASAASTATDHGSTGDPASLDVPCVGGAPIPALPVEPARSMSTPADSQLPDGSVQRIPFRGIRRTTAESLHHSVQTTVHFTVMDEADITALDAKRKEYSAILGQKIGYLPMVMTAACHALRRHPELNATMDDEAGEIHRMGAIHMGCAVDTEHGLMVPVITHTDRLGLVEMADAVRTAAAACRNRTINREDLTGGSFTISNVGSYGGMFATPIINYPEVAILAIGRVTPRVLVKDGTFFQGSIIPLSLSCDHRVVDGAEAARFLHTVVGILEDPVTLLGI